MSGFFRRINVKLITLDRHWLLSGASFLFFSNLVVNVPVVERFGTPDGHLMPGTKSLLYGYHAVSLAGAVVLLLASKRLRSFAFEVRAHHVVLGFVLLEAFLRLVIFTDFLKISLLENPRLYSTGSCGDDGYFVLRHYYDREPPRGEPHPQFGWVAGVGELEIITDRYFSLADVSERPILFFGDSFVAWGEVMEEKLPQMVDDALADFAVLNYGVPGYGLDQIWLRFRAEYPKFAERRPIVLLGMLLDDQDRALLRYRVSQKPYFELENGKLELHSPKYPTNREYFDDFHFHTKSFALSPLAVVFKKLFRSETWCSTRRRELNRAILKEMVGFIEAHELEAYVVVFYTPNDLSRTSVLEEELDGILAEFRFDDVIDTKEFLLPYLEAQSADKTVLYDDGGAGHHTVEARRVIAAGIVERLRKRHPAGD